MMRKSRWILCLAFKLQNNLCVLGVWTEKPDNLFQRQPRKKLNRPAAYINMKAYKTDNLASM